MQPMIIRSRASQLIRNRLCTIASTAEQSEKLDQKTRKPEPVENEIKPTVFVDAAEIRGYHLKGIGAFWGDNDPKNLSLKLGPSLNDSYLSLDQLVLQAVNIVLYQGVSEKLPAITVQSGYFANFSYLDGLLNRGWLRAWEKNKWRKRGGKNEPIVDARIDLFELDILGKMIQVNFELNRSPGPDQPPGCTISRDLAQAVTEESMSNVDYKQKYFGELYEKVLRNIDKYPPGPPRKPRKPPRFRA